MDLEYFNTSQSEPGCVIKRIELGRRVANEYSCL
jgi:hypothetical protein